jgi:hypothetical protein
MSAPRLLFLGFLVRDEDAATVFDGEAHPQVSALRFQRNLMMALEGAGAEIDAVTTPPIAPFPRSRRAWIAGASYRLRGYRLRGRQMAGPNLPVLRFLARFAQAIRLGRQCLPAPCDGVLVYSLHTPFVAAALALKALRRVPVFVVIPDIPTLMGGPTNPVKRALKAVDAALVRRLLRAADGAFPVADGTGRDWLAGRPRYWPMEGISDEAAAVLAAARSTGAFVYHGVQRPRLLYTGVLAYLMRFAEAFHRSSVDATVVFMGGGDDYAPLQRLAAIDARIEVRPFATGAAFAQEVDRADFMLNPRDPDWAGSNYSFPWKLFDYLVTGKPIISTRLRAVPPVYFTVFRPVDLDDTSAFDRSLTRALRPDGDPDAIWTGAEQLARRLSSARVGPELLSRMREWSRPA